MDDDELLQEPELVEPPYCACKGLCPQMREHTRIGCSIMTTAEVNGIWLLMLSDRTARGG